MKSRATTALRFARKHSVAFVCLLALTVSGSIQYFWINPKAAELDQLFEKIVVTEEKIKLNEARYSELSGKTVDEPEMVPGKIPLARYFQYNTLFSSVVNGIMQNSTDGAFSLTKVLSESQNKVGSYTQTLYSLEVEASFISVGKFLEKLEEAPLLTEIESIEITRIANEMKKCKAKIKLFSYVRAGQ